MAVAGLGGLGSNIAVMLARSGVGHLFLVDFDVVDVTNLNRQAYSASHIGKPKTEAIKDIIAEINPYLDVEVCCKTVDENNAEELFGSYDIVCEAFDRAENKSMLISFLLSAWSRNAHRFGKRNGGLRKLQRYTNEKNIRALIRMRRWKERN